MDTEDLIPPSLPLQKGEIPPLWQRGVRGDFGRICLINYGLLSNLAIMIQEQSLSVKNNSNIPLLALPQNPLSLKMNRPCFAGWPQPKNETILPLPDHKVKPLII